jgi:hypothetical protein
MRTPSYTALLSTLFFLSQLTFTPVNSLPLEESVCVMSSDSSLTVCVDVITGYITSLCPLSLSTRTPWLTQNTTTLLGNGSYSVGTPIVTRLPNNTITVVRKWVFGGGSPVGSGATVIETLSPRATSVRWHVNVLGDSVEPWSVPIVTCLYFGLNASLGLKAWAPWDRGSVNGWSETWVDPLLPSDSLPGGWWNGIYRVGNARDGRSDFVVAPLATVISADPDSLDVGVSIHLAPTDIPMDTHFFLEGANGGLSFSRAHYRISAITPIELDIDLVGHQADWRSALAWSVAAWPTYWEPHNPEVFTTSAGTGSYSYWLGSLDQTPPYTEMAYKTNWDLSGRFFPYMGMFLPPVLPGEEWLNDAEGSQPRANVTFEIIGAWYRKMADAGFIDYSYANVNEYGINVVLPPVAVVPSASKRTTLPLVDAAYISKLFRRVAGFDSSAAPLTCVNTWQNASACLAEAFPDAAIILAWDEIGSNVHHGSFVSWQGSIVIDAGVEQYHAFMLEQLARHIVFEDAFSGYIIDRSDWMDVSSLQRDDGLTFIPEAIAKTGSGIAASMKITYQRMVNDLRAVLDAGPAALAELRKEMLDSERAAVHHFHIGNMSGSGLMMMNLVGNARLDQYAPYDGIFSEGPLVSGAGLLGLMSPAILWTYNSHECCRTASWADFYFQRHLLMNVMPMLPFPGNDHAIPFDPVSAAYYVRYGPMMAAIAPSVWALFPHIVSLGGTNTTTTTNFTYAKVNAFVAPINNATDVVLLVPIMLGEAANGTVALNLTGISRLWPAAAAGESVHPLVRKKNAHNAAAPSTTVTSYVIEAIWPGAGDAWTQIAGPFTTDSMVVQVELQSNATLVRARRAT